MENLEAGEMAFDDLNGRLQERQLKGCLQRDMISSKLADLEVSR